MVAAGQGGVASYTLRALLLGLVCVGSVIYNAFRVQENPKFLLRISQLLLIISKVC